MNSFKILNELQRCAERNEKLNSPHKIWDVWFKGKFLGYIHKWKNGVYAVYDKEGIRHEKDHSNFSSAISSFVSSAKDVITSEFNERISREPVIKQIGLRENKSLLSKILDWFK